MYKIGLCGYGYRAHFYLKIAKMTKEFEILVFILIRKKKENILYQMVIKH